MVVIVVIVVPHSSIPYYNVTKGKDCGQELEAQVGSGLGV